MFTSEEQVRTFVDLLEKFTKSIANQQIWPSVEGAAVLNKYRDGFEAFINVISGITEASNTTDALLCPDCNAEMALRTNRTNGQKFYGCKKYPNCKGTRDENGLSRQDKEEKKQRDESIAQEGGFSFNRDKRNPVTEVSPLDTVQYKGETNWINPFTR